VDLVRVDVIVLDREGRPVQGLSADDFQVFEDDTPQNIEAFSEIRLTGSSASAWLRDVPADVASNQAALDGRVVVIVMDDATAPPHPGITEEAKRLAREVVGQLGPDDQAAVVFTLDARRAQGLTTDRGRLLAAIDGFSPSVGFVKGVDEISFWHFYQGSIAVLSQLADILAGISDRRKALAFISVGVPVDVAAAASPHAMPARPSSADEVTALGSAEMHRDLLQQTRVLFARAQRANIAIYALDPAGLAGVESVLLQPGYGADGSHGMTLAAASTRAALGREFLRTVAENTGGFALTEGADTAAGIIRMFDQTGAYYLLGYRVDPDRRTRDRRLRIEVNRTDVVVRARTALVGREAESTDEARDVEATLARALAGVVPESELPMVVNVIPMAVAGERDAVLVIVARLHQPAPVRRTVERVELRVGAFDSDGRQRASKRQRAELALLPTDSEAEYEVLTQMKVPPGRYSLRLAGYRTSAAETGSVFHDIDVPDFSRAELELSGIALAASPGVLAAPRDALVDVLPILPTTQREFDRAERVTALVRVYRGRRSAGSAVRLDLRILAADGTAAVEEARTIEEADFGAARAVEHRFTLPLEALPAGAYALQIRASADEVAVMRMVPFAVR
jgi:VWFA-related protein